MKLCVVTGEASGDLHSASVIAQLRRLLPAIDVFGVGGSKLQSEGVRIIQPIDQMSVVGLFNVLRHIPMFRRIFAKVITAIATERPDAVLLVDFPEFNLRVARQCRKLGIPVIYFISPQLWAWRRGRIREIRRNVDLMLVIFPFEERFYREHSVNAWYVGHPLVDQLEGVRRKGLPWSSSRPPRIVLLPGSRASEVGTLLPPMLDAIADLRRERELHVELLQAPTISDHQLREAMGGRGGDIRITTDIRGALATADLAIAASGTVTLECAIVGVPVIVVYRLGALTYPLARRLVRIPHFSLVNIVAGRMVVPELLQGDARGPKIAEEAVKLLAPKRHAEVIADLDEVRHQLGAGGAARRAAEKIATLLRQGQADSREAPPDSR